MKAYAEGREGWIICPKCLDACVGIVGKSCSTCGTPQVLTPLLGHVVVEGKAEEAICEDLGREHTPEELALLEEFGV